MKHPNLNEEKKLWKAGYNIVAGVDEAGRGPLAGPVVASAAVIVKTLNKKIIKKINDSKKLTAKQREEVYDMVSKNQAVIFGVGKVSEKIILPSPRHRYRKYHRKLEESGNLT